MRRQDHALLPATTTVPADDVPTAALVRFAWRAGFAPARLVQMHRDGLLKVVRVDEDPAWPSTRRRTVLGPSDRAAH